MNINPWTFITKKIIDALAQKKTIMIMTNTNFKLKLKTSVL